ncbi:MAG: peptide deformylase [Actinomycetota bacterium]
MTILTICQLGDPVLRQPAAPVERFDEALEALAADMIETMYDAPGVGLAAPQIGRSIRLVVYDDGDGTGARVLVNPAVSGPEGEEVMDEGCLSVRGPYAETKRAARLHVRAQDLQGRPVEFDAEGFLARIMQHETDHLEGLLFIDRLDDEGRREVMRQLREQEVSGGRLGRRPRG